MQTGLYTGLVSYGQSRTYSSINKTLTKEAEALATGSKISRAKNDAAALVIAETLTSKYRGIEMAEINVGNGISMMETADAALGEIGSNLQEIRELAVQANNGTLSSTEKQAIQDEIDAKLGTINDIANNTEYNGKKLLNGSLGEVDILTSHDSADIESIDLGGNFRTSSSTADGNINEDNTGGSNGVALNSINVVTGNASDILAGIDNAISNVTAKRTDLGAQVNGFESKLENLAVEKQAVLESRSRLADVDYARSASTMVQTYVLQNSSIAVQSQANLNARLVMNLLPNVS